MEKTLHTLDDKHTEMRGSRLIGQNPDNEELFKVAQLSDGQYTATQVSTRTQRVLVE